MAHPHTPLPPHHRHGAQCGMARFPNTPYLLTLYANFMVAARADGQVGRTQLQLAQKAAPGIVDR
jgi:hypothetical protein